MTILWISTFATRDLADYIEVFVRQLTCAYGSVQNFLSIYILIYFTMQRELNGV